jgi:hypothetical protein
VDQLGQVFLFAVVVGSMSSLLASIDQVCVA